MFQYPTLTSPRKSGSAFRQISTMTATMTTHLIGKPLDNEPHRYNNPAPINDGLFIKTLKQSVIKDTRLLPMTRMMIILLSGWDGSGKGNLCTNIGTIAKHLKRSRRMVFHYLKEAVAFGYLNYKRTKDRLGYYTGIKIELNFSLIRKKTKNKEDVSGGKQTQRQANQDVKYTSQTNKNIFNNLPEDDKIMQTLARFAARAGYLDPESEDKHDE